jgi:hypothetical protein
MMSRPGLTLGSVVHASVAAARDWVGLTLTRVLRVAKRERHQENSR